MGKQTYYKPAKGSIMNLKEARAEVLVGTGVDVVMIPVVLYDVDASTPGLTAVADDSVLLLEAVDVEGRCLRLLQCLRMSHLP